MRKRTKMVTATQAQADLSQAGMTLMEIMIVLAIIAVVMGFLVGPRVYRMFKASKEETAMLRSLQFVEAQTEWALNDDADCPDSLADLGKYMNSKETVDPWGQEYVMVCGEEAPEGVSFGVLSFGPDKKRGTKDDVKSWEGKKRKKAGADGED